MKKLFCFVFQLVAIIYIFLPSKNTFANEKQEDTAKSAPQKNKFYVITKITYEITGNILEAALEEKLQLRNGLQRFKSEGDFQAYIKNKNAELINIRALEESSKIEFVTTYNEEKKQYDVTLTIQAKEGVTIFASPYFKYSSNSGFLLSARGRDYNFLGSLQRFLINLDYRHDEEGRDKGEINTSFQYPLQVGEKNLFTLALAEDISYRSDNQFFNKTSFSTKHSYSINSIISWNSLFSQDFISETDLKKDRIFSSGKSTAKTGASVLLTPRQIPIIKSIRYNANVSTSFKYSLTDQDPTPKERYDITPAINHELDMGQINEIRNFRQGLTLILRNENSYSAKEKTWTNSISAETKLHGTLGNVFGIDARIYGIQNFYTYLDPSKKDNKDAGSGIGDKLRGVLDKEFKNANNAFAVNVSLLLKLFSITPFAEFHFGLFSDFGIRTRTGEKNTFSLEEDLKTTIGIEMLSFALFARSIIVRISYGIDLTQAIRDGKLEPSNREMFIGLSRYF